MQSRRIAAGWSELPGVMAGNIIISLSLMATSTPPFISPLPESGEKLQAFSFWESDSQRDRKMDGNRKSGRERCQFRRKVAREERKWEGVNIYKDVQKDEEVERREMKSETEQTNRECEEQVRWQ